MAKKLHRPVAKKTGHKKRIPTSKVSEEIITEVKTDARPVETASTTESKQQKSTTAGRLPSAFMITSKALDVIWNNRRLFIGIGLVYLLLDMLFVRGFSGGANITEIKDALGNLGSGLTHLSAGLALFTVLLTSSGNSSSQAAGAYHSFLLVITSLAIIWALRQVLAGEKIRVRDSFYRGMYPLVPVLLVLSYIGLQLLPLLIGAALYSIVVSNGIVAHWPEHLIAGGLYFGVAVLTLYVISSSVIALYIAALPDMTPLRAIRSAKQLVRHKRWSIGRKLLFLPVALLTAGAVLMLPIILYATPLAPWAFFVLSAVSVVLAHSYLYTLYRELLP